MKAADSNRLLERVTQVYARRLRENPAASECLRARGITDAVVLEHFQAGYSDGTLPGLLPKAGEAKEILTKMGLLKPTGEEVLLGCLVLPVTGKQGGISGFEGIQPSDASGPEEILVPASVEGLVRGPLVRDGSPLFLTDSALDGFVLWVNGLKNVAAVAGKTVSACELKALAQDNVFRNVYLCLRQSEIIRSFNQLSPAELGFSVTPIQWPAGIIGAREFFRTHTALDFETLLPKIDQPTVTAEATNVSVAETPEGLNCCLDGRHYELRAVQRPGPGRLKATVKLRGEQDRFVVETMDFYNARGRRGFLSEAARLLHQPLEVLEEDLRKLTDALERYVEKRAKGSCGSLTVEGSDRGEGVKLGRARDLVGEIVRDLGTLGMIGEENNKLLAYLVMTSRKLAEPLAMLMLSGSGAGKSHLQDTVLALCPEEDLVKLTSLTDQALFYRGENSLRHKVLALEELAGAKGADYAIRNLISARKLVIETTVKNPLTGKLETQVNTVHGPTAVFQTTTNPHTDAETRSRFIVVSVDESPAQTRAILEKQRQLHTLEALRQRQERDELLRRHHAFQRLLRPLPVINPFEPLLSYPEEYLVVRRDHPKYLRLILAVAFLHQMQRPVRQDPAIGEYVEATLDDITIANELAHQAFGNSLADLSQPARQLLSLITDFMDRKAASSAADKSTFSRREIREAIHWGDTRLRIHLRELVELEYVAPLSGRFGVTYHYRLLEHGCQDTGRFLPGLKAIDQLRREAILAGIASYLAPTSHTQNREVSAGLNTSPLTPCAAGPQTSHPPSAENISTAPGSGADQ